ncbi:hypothetical protein DEO23_05760 [Brachybacterium endophyticum]|uniref:Uncharacterized protein n=2 Tax=Brachybacterium endophyticum TaxID=2182385 RepID=A0A2U2RL05_9MICO|nr:hypothetical protein DEO23_05760 [Brachybacterium endophyticum]
MILAMGSDGRLTIDRPVSKRLLYNKRAIQDIFLMWYPEKLRAFDVDAPVRDEDAAPQRGTFSCFTGGADSFDTLINNRDDIDAICYVHGYDIALSRTEIRDATSSHLREVAAETGKELIEISTNIRRFQNRAGSWPLIAHGAALASVGHLLSARFGRMLMPGSYTFADTFAWGTHPILDHRWSTDRLSVVDDGNGSDRVTKIVGLSRDPVAQRHLRVCWQNTGKYNCGECEKCKRTMITLAVEGVLPDFETFESTISLQAIRDMKVSSDGKRSYAQANLDHAEAKGATEIADVLRGLIADYDAKVEKKAQASAAKAPKTQAATGKGAGAKPASATAQTAASGAGGTAALEKRLRAVEKRLSATESRTAAHAKTLDKIQKLWPVRSWGRFAAWRHGE